MEHSIAIGFGKVLRRLRLASGMTQEELGLEAGLQRNYISSLERGEKQPSLTTIFRLAKAMDTLPSAFLEIVETELSGKTPRDS